MGRPHGESSCEELMWGQPPRLSCGAKLRFAADGTVPAISPTGQTVSVLHQAGREGLVRIRASL